MDARVYLPAGLVLDTRYRIDAVVGSGGFGVTYRAFDQSLQRPVAVKEYYPDQFASRDGAGSLEIRPSHSKQDAFSWGRDSFLKEARLMARFHHPAIVRVFTVFEAYATAYMVMEFVEGQSLESWLKGLGRKPTQAECDRIFTPMLAALEVMHAEGFLHRDIAPDNIMIKPDGNPVLLDFGAARRAVAERTQMLTGLVKQGYSPHEQYSADGKHQGPWTDLYALGATFYRALAGRAPEESPSRMVHDTILPLAGNLRGAYRASFLAALDACLKLQPGQRPQSVAQLRALDGGAVAGGGAAGQTVLVPQSGGAATSNAARRRMALGITLAALLVAIAVGTWLILVRGAERQRVQLAQQQAELARLAAEEQARLEAARAREAEAKRLQEDAQRREDEVKRREEEETKRRLAQEEEQRRARDGRDLKALLPKETKAEFLARLKQEEEMRQARREGGGWLGVKIQNVDDDMAAVAGLPDVSGAAITELTAGGPGAGAGMQVGDVVRAIDGVKTENSAALALQVARRKPGTRVQLEVRRKGRSLVLAVVLGQGEPVADLSALDRIGVTLKEEAGRVLVATVKAGSDAEAKGLRAGTIVHEVGGTAVTTVAEASDNMKRVQQLGRRSVLLRVEDGGETRFVAVQMTQ